MNLRNNAQSLSFIIYGLFALSLLLLYNGVSSLYGNALADFILGQRQNVLIFQIGYGDASALILIGALTFFFMRYIAARLEDKDIISPENSVRFWILGGVAILTSLFAVFDLFTILSGVLTGRGDNITLFVTLVTLLTLAGILIFCVSEIKRKEELRFISPLSLLFMVFCFGSFLLGFSIAPPWTAREAREDQQQLQRLQKIKQGLDDMRDKKLGLPQNLEDIHSYAVNSRNDILDGVTHKPFIYEKLSDSSFKLCGEFLTDFDVYMRFRLYPKEFVEGKPHHKGQTCYTVDLSLKPPAVPNLD